MQLPASPRSLFLAVIVPPGTPIALDRGVSPAPRTQRPPLPLGTMPRTAAQRRREQIRRSCLHLLPLLLFGLASAPRVWAPDLAPFTAAHGATLTAAGFEGQAYSFDGINDLVVSQGCCDGINFRVI